MPVIPSSREERSGTRSPRSGMRPCAGLRSRSQSPRRRHENRPNNSRGARAVHQDPPGRRETGFWAYGYPLAWDSRPRKGSEFMGRVSAFAGWRKSGLLVFALATVAVLAASPAAAQNPKTYVITPLVSNLGPPGPGVDTRLVNAWGLVAGPPFPSAVAYNGAVFSTLHTADGTKVPLNVSVAGAPTGIVFNADANAFPVGTG